jgi:hypothetical protein
MKNPLKPIKDSDPMKSHEKSHEPIKDSDPMKSHEIHESHAPPLPPQHEQHRRIDRVAPESRPVHRQTTW